MDDFAKFILRIKIEDPGGKIINYTTGDMWGTKESIVEHYMKFGVFTSSNIYYPPSQIKKIIFQKKSGKKESSLMKHALGEDLFPF